MSYEKESQDQKATKKRSIRRRELQGLIVLIIIAIGITIGLIVYFLQNPPGDSDLDQSKQKQWTVVEVATQNGIQSLINMRNVQYSWVARQNAEAIMALRLGNTSQFPLSDKDFLLSVKAMELELLGAVSSSAVDSTLWAHGKLGQYVTALVSTCKDPLNFYNHDLSQILKNQLATYKTYFESQRFALSWMVLGLCTANVDIEAEYMDILADHPGNYTFRTDEASMIVMALSCVNNSAYDSAQRAAQEYILSKMQPDGTFGNMISTGLALQAMTRFQGHSVSVEEEIRVNLAAQVLGKFTNVATANQILPALAKKSYVDVRDMCPSKVTSTTVMPLRFVNLDITVRDFIISPQNFSMTWNISIGEGQTVFQALQKLQLVDSSFNFTSVTTSWGESITSIVNIEPDVNERQYFRFLEFPDISMTTGVSSAIPVNDTHYIFEVTTW